jgi:radical SAM protein with 4Fe4S-binding SPASM domain
MKKPFRRAYIEITNSCNLACGFCASSARAAEEMPLELFESAAAQAGGLAEVVSLHLLGEPLTHSRFPEILAACTRLGLRVNLVTNGLLLERFRRELFSEPCLSQISVSLQALTCLPEAELVPAINRLAGFAAAKPERLTVGFRLRSGGGGPFRETATRALHDAFGLRPDPAAPYVRLGDGIFLNFGGFFSWPGAGGPSRRSGCLGLRHNFGILSDGRVVPCCADHDGALALGSVAETPLAQILSSSSAATLRQSLASGSLPPRCASCGFSAFDS